MSNENEKPTPAGGEESKGSPEAAKAGLSQFIATAMALKEQKPLVFYGGLAALVLIVLGLFFLGGGGGERVPAPTIQVGQTYQLVNPNVTGGGDVLLLQAPGRMGATDPELREKEQICVVEAGTQAKVLEQAVVSYVQYVKVEPLAGNCQGKSGWTSYVNLKTQ
ncbi:MAG: hypothetical protein N3A55_09795 [Methylohalobius sp.]|nr:hypothetical protein [Methylohalobius sp.]